MDSEIKNSYAVIELKSSSFVEWIFSTNALNLRLYQNNLRLFFRAIPTITPNPGGVILKTGIYIREILLIK